MYDKLSIKALEIYNFYKNRTFYKDNKIFYNSNFLFNYIPNKINLLNKNELNFLMEKANIFIEKSELIKGKIEYLKEGILNSFLMDLTYISSKLEGCAYNEEDVSRIIYTNMLNYYKSEFEYSMVKGHAEAIEFLLKNYKNLNLDINIIKNIHYFLGKYLLKDEYLGEIRKNEVFIYKSNYSPLINTDDLIKNLLKILEIVNQIQNPIEQAFFLLVHISYLQGFIDLNKRTARVLCNFPLLKNNLCPISFIEMPKDLYTYGLFALYEKNDFTLIKEVFIYIYEASCNYYAKFIDDFIERRKKYEYIRNYKKNLQEPPPIWETNKNLISKF